MSFASSAIETSRQLVLFPFSSESIEKPIRVQSDYNLCHLVRKNIQTRLSGFF